MSIRNSDYTIDKERYKYICEIIKTFIYHDVLIDSARESNIYIADYLVESIEFNLSYERISGRHYIPINKNDFYAYRRKCLWIFAGRIHLVV